VDYQRGGQRDFQLRLMGADQGFGILLVMGREICIQPTGRSLFGITSKIPKVLPKKKGRGDKKGG